MTYEEILLRIQACSINDSDELDLFIDDILVEVEDLALSIAQKKRLIEQLLVNIENQSEPKFTSLSLLHFLEWLDEDNSTTYNIQVLRSLNRKPKYMTLLLANRILNAMPDTSTDRILFLSALKEVASKDSLEEYVRNEAREFYEYQLNKEAEN